MFKHDFSKLLFPGAFSNRVVLKVDFLELLQGSQSFQIVYLFEIVAGSNDVGEVGVCDESEEGIIPQTAYTDRYWLSEMSMKTSFHLGRWSRLTRLHSSIWRVLMFFSLERYLLA